MYTKVANAEKQVAKTYWFILGIVLALGFSINYWMVTLIPASAVMAINPIVLLIGYFVLAFGGIWLSHSSDDPKISFLGYMMVVVPVGVVIVPFVQSFDPMIVEKAVLFTAMLSGLMAFGGFTFPQFFRSIGGILFWALLAAIIAEIIVMIIGYELAAMDWIVAVIFLGFIGYDFSMALEDEPTIDAAIDRAVALYLDIINLFLRILSIMGKSRD